LSIIDVPKLELWSGLQAADGVPVFMVFIELFVGPRLI
jgi:hypothetical protein